MYSTIVGSVGSAELVFFVILAAALVGLVLWARRDLKNDTNFDPVHSGKKHHGGCKYDTNEVHRTKFLAKPKIDVSNLPAPDPRVVALLNGVSQQVVVDHLNKFTGVTAWTLNGKSVKIPSRSSFSPSLNLAYSYAEEHYKSLGISVSLFNYQKMGRKLSNVVAEIPGTTEPNKVLIIGAHIDSTAGNQFSNEPVAPGADDDGSGCTALFEIARALKQLKLGYTVRLVHFSGEEQGLWGSYAYSDFVAQEGKDIVGVLQIDMVGYSVSKRVDIHDGVDANGSHDLVVELFRQAKRYNLDLIPFDTHNHAVDGRSDHAGFIDHGKKAVLISSEFDDSVFNPHYHSTTDEVSTLNLPYMIEVIKMVIATAAELAKIQP